DPVNEMERELTRLKTEFASICRWILVYELVKMPILPPAMQSRESSIVRKACERSIGAVKENLSEARLLEHLSTPTLANSLVTDPLQSFLEVMSHPPTNPVSLPSPDTDPWFPRVVPDVPVNSAAEPTPPLLDIEELKSQLDRLMRQDDRQEVVRLIQQQFAVRYHLAIAASILFLEKLFFYLLEHYRCCLAEISQELIKRHENYLGAGAIDIQTRLLAAHAHQREEIIQALTCLHKLEKVDRIQTESPISSVSQAA
ncbi:MAG TPA: hypothetical protein V6C65_15380, partial [Allocoleopsis sp.]